MKTKIDLITGFLGAGKTTFLKRYLHYLINKGERICVLEFDYGAVNVDMMLLQEFNDLCDLEMVAGGCDKECHFRRFKTKLIAMGMKKYDRVVIEPSGIFDMDELFDTVREEPLDQWYEIESVTCVVDPVDVIRRADEQSYYFLSQIAFAGKILLNKVQMCSKEIIEQSINVIKEKLSNINIKIDLNDFVSFDINNLSDDVFEIVKKASYYDRTVPKNIVDIENDYQSVYIMNNGLTKEKLESFINIVFNNNEFGNVIRIKGFFASENEWFEVNATAFETNYSKLEKGQDVIIVIGKNLIEERITGFFK